MPAAQASRSRRAVGGRLLGHAGWPLRSDLILVGFWAVVATVLGRGLAPALPGVSDGIGALITGVNQLSAFATQFAVIAGVAACLRLLLSTTQRLRGRVFRSTAILCCAAALPLIISASSHDLEPVWLASLVGLSGLLGLVAAAVAASRPHVRAGSLALLVVALGSLVSAGARMIALEASGDAQVVLFRLARGIATAGLGLDLLATVLVAVWLSRRIARGGWLVGGATAVPAIVVWLALQAGEADHFRLVVERALEALTSHPDPFIGSGVRYFAELWALCVASLTLWIRRPEGLGATLTFALLSRVSGDVPLCALMLLIASLAAVRASLLPGPARGPRRRSRESRASLEVIPATR